MADPEIQARSPMVTITVRLEASPDQLAAVFDTELPRVATRMDEVGAVMAGPPFARYHQFGPGRVDVEIGAPIVEAPVALPAVSGRPDGVIGASSLPGGDAAVTIHHGSYDGLSASYDRLAAWMAAQGLIAGDGPWEVYLTDPRLVPDPVDWRTEIVWPLVRP